MENNETKEMKLYNYQVLTTNGDVVINAIESDNVGITPDGKTTLFYKNGEIVAAVPQTLIWIRI